MTNASVINNIELLKFIKEKFSLEDVKTLCFDIGVNFDDIPGSTITEKSRELIIYCRNQNRLENLVDQLKRDRPLNELEFQSEEISPPKSTSNIKSECPYRGLNYFEEIHADFFFGRETITNSIVERVLNINDNCQPNERFLALIGGSGIGKSSMVRAGVVPKIRSLTNWKIVVFRPSKTPLTRLHQILRITFPSSFIDDGNSDLDSFDSLFLSKFFNGSVDDHVLFIIDQFEEVFSLCKNETERETFIGNLLNASFENKKGNFSLIITLRSDFYRDCGEYEILRSAIINQDYLGPMRWEEARRAIEKPAIYSGFEFDGGLVNTILNDAGKLEGKNALHTGTLPLLSLALKELWEVRNGNLLTFEGYGSIGGVQGVINSKIEELYSQFSQKEKTITRNIFLQLSETRYLDGDDAITDLRNLITLNKLIAESDDEETTELVLEKLVGNRLLVISKPDLASEAVIEVSHEALIKHWARLQEWLSYYQDYIRRHQNIRKDAENWQYHSGDLCEGKTLKDYETFYYSIPDAKDLKTKWGFIPEKKRHLVNFWKKIFSDELELGDEVTSIPYYRRFGQTEINFLTKSIEERQKKKVIQTRNIFLTGALLGLGFLIIWLTSQLSAYNGNWIHHDNMYGSLATELFVDPVDPNHIFLALLSPSKTILVHSADNGNNWTRIDQNGLPQIKINQIIVPPWDTNQIFLGTFGGGVYLSGDGGATWQSRNLGLKNFVISDFVIGSERDLYLTAYGENGGVYKTTNDGLSWQHIGQDPALFNAENIIFDPNSAILYVSTVDNGVYKSFDNGETWSRTGLSIQNVPQIAVDSKGTLFAGTQRNGVFTSQDRGDSWRPLNDNLPSMRQFSALFVHEPSDDLYAAIDTIGGSQFYKFNESTHSWLKLSNETGGSVIRSIVDNKIHSDKLFLISVIGMHEYDVKDDTWKKIIIPDITDTTVKTMSFSEDSSTIYAGAYGGIYRSQNDGASWDFFNFGLTHPDINVIKADPHDPGLVYIGTYAKGETNAFFVSDDYGQTWIPIGNGLADDDVRAIAIDGTNSNIIYVGTYGSGMYKSTDRGNTWYPINKGIEHLEIIDLEVDPYDPESIYSLSAGGPVFVSKNGGVNWISFDETQNLDIRDISISPINSDICMVINGFDIDNVRCISSEDFTYEFSVPSDTLAGIVFAPNGDIFVRTENDGVFWSHDKGGSWNSINKGLATNKIKFIATFPNDSSRLFASVEGQGGVFDCQIQPVWKDIYYYVYDLIEKR